jgi:hypothetical protein
MDRSRSRLGGEIVERESDQEVRDRQEKARTDAIRERQVRLGHVSAEPQEQEEPEEEAPKAKRAPRKRKTAG